MSAVNTQEEKDQHPKPTFDINFAVSVLACSLPFSTLLIIGIFSFSEFVLDPYYLILIGSVLVGTSFIPYLIQKVKRNKLGLSVYSDLEGEATSKKAS